MKAPRQLVRQFVDQFPTLARAYRNVRDSRRLGDQPVVTPLGFKFLGNPTMQDGRFEPEETRLISKLLSEVDVVVDVGANMGYYCCLALSKGKAVVAFEPIWLNAQYVLRNIEANGWTDGFELFILAASDRNGIAKIFGGGTGASLVRGWANASVNHVTYVPTSTVDSVLGTRLEGRQALFIVDVEGAETSVIKGAIDQLTSSPKPLWIVEIIATQQKGIGRNPHYLEAFEAFWTHGYEAWTTTGTPRLVDRRMVEQVAFGGADVISSPNILFVEAGTGRRLVVDL